MKKIKAVLIIIAIVVLAAAAVFAMYKMGLLGKVKKIDDTENVVTQIKTISEFTSACFYEEIAVTAKDGRKELVIISNGTIRAGFDLSKISEDDIVASDSTIMISLPPAEIFDIIVNPSDCEIWLEEGKWSGDKVAELQQKISKKLETDAINEGILKKARENGVERLKDLFQSFGYNDVVITVKPSATK